MRLPLAPTGWPTPIAPPSTLSRSRAIWPAGAVEAERVAAELGVVPGRETAQHLRGEGFVELPQFDVAERKLVPLEDRGRAIDRAESHDGGIERRPFAVDDDGLRL